MGDPKAERNCHDFDVVIVGSGYGGSVAAAALSGCTDSGNRKVRVCVLERGREYLAGSFPSRAADLAGYIRFTTPNAKRQRGTFDGLYDIRWSEDAVAVLACGLGGGSLINAGVLEMPLERVFKEMRWPRQIQDHAEEIVEDGKVLRDKWFEPEQLTRTFDNKEELPKFRALSKLAKSKSDKFRAAKITVSGANQLNFAKVCLDKCLRCGDCATGCNHNAKNSLDLNLLRIAKQNKAEIFTGVTVLRVKPVNSGKNGWLLHLNHSDSHLRDRQKYPFVLRARYVILAAGTFGSTEILVRSDDVNFRLSRQLRRKFSANGDMIVTAYATNRSVNAIADETCEPDPCIDGKGRNVGPTITGMIDLRNRASEKGDPEPDVVIQDLTIPGALRRLFEEATTTYDVLDRLADGDFRKHDSHSTRRDDAAIDHDALRRSLVLAMIGRDSAEGELRFGQQAMCDDADGLLTVSWPELRNDPRFAANHLLLDKMLLDPASKLGGRVVSNLLWRPFSEKLENILGQQRGPVLTVHPLGGCAMGDDVTKGVTDYCGRVFNAADRSKQSTFYGLAVLDGSIVPTSLGINPSLTIAVLASRAIAELKKGWELKSPEISASVPVRRPIFARPVVKTEPKPTRIELTEQVRGCVPLNLRRRFLYPTLHPVELTLTTEPVTVADLFGSEAKHRRCLPIRTRSDGQVAQGKLRILAKDFKLRPHNRRVRQGSRGGGNLRQHVPFWAGEIERMLASSACVECLVRQ